jgi:hypothetical protein
LFDGFSGIIDLSDFSGIYMPVFGLGLHRPDCLRDYNVYKTASPEISRFPLMKLMHMPQVSDSGESK